MKPRFAGQVVKATAARQTHVVQRYNATIREAINLAVDAVYRANNGPQWFCVGLNNLSMEQGRQHVARQIERAVVGRLPAPALSALKGARVTAPSFTATLAGGQDIPWASVIARFYDATPNREGLPDFGAAMRAVVEQLPAVILERCSTRAPAPAPQAQPVGRQAPPGCEWRYTWPSGNTPGRWNLVCNYQERPFGE